MPPDDCGQIDIDNLFYRCAKIRRTVLITYLATIEPLPDGVPDGLPDMTAFDCSHRHICGVCAPAGPWTDCRWDRCVHPGLAGQEPSTEAEPEPSPNEDAP